MVLFNVVDGGGEGAVLMAVVVFRNDLEVGSVQCLHWSRSWFARKEVATIVACAGVSVRRRVLFSGGTVLCCVVARQGA